jgi:hypothetical protein
VSVPFNLEQKKPMKKNDFEKIEQQSFFLPGRRGV